MDGHLTWVLFRGRLLSIITAISNACRISSVIAFLFSEMHFGNRIFCLYLSAICRSHTGYWYHIKVFSEELCRQSAECCWINVLLLICIFKNSAKPTFLHIPPTVRFCTACKSLWSCSRKLLFTPKRIGECKGIVMMMMMIHVWIKNEHHLHHLLLMLQSLVQIWERSVFFFPELHVRGCTCWQNRHNVKRS